MVLCSFPDERIKNRGKFICRFGKIIKGNENDDEETVESDLGPNGGPHFYSLL